MRREIGIEALIIKPQSSIKHTVFVGKRKESEIMKKFCTHRIASRCSESIINDLT